MSFTVRTVTQRTGGGGDIIRKVRHDKNVLTIGRGTDCDVQVADLAVMLNHLTLERSGGLVSIVATEGVPFELDGGFVENAMLGGGDTASVVIGSHRLAIGPGETAGDTLVGVERIAPVLDASSKDEAREFSLGGVAPGKRKMAWILALLILGLGLAWPIAAFVQGQQNAKLRPDQAWLSGSLAKAHANLKGGCQACHVKAFVSVQDNSCVGCHKAAHDHATPSRMLRAHADLGLGDRARLAVGGVFGLAPERCSSCHREHEGPKTALVVSKTFCADCHRDLKARLPETGLADVPDFAGHPELRPTLGTQRVSMALRPRDDPGLIFPHRLHLASGGGVARMALSLKMGGPLTCASCHKPRADGVGYRPVEMERDCGACHALGGLPHGDVKRAVVMAAGLSSGGPSTSRRRPGEIAAAPRGGGTGVQTARALFAPGGVCADCHRLLPPSQAGGLPRVAPVRLTERYFPLGGFDHSQHKFSACADCHATALSDSAADLMMPNIARCRDCHARPAAPHPASGACTECHGFHAAGQTPSRRAYTQRVIEWDRRIWPTKAPAPTI